MFDNPWEPLGHAMLDYHRGDTSAKIIVLCDLEDPLEEPLSTFFRDAANFSAIEKTAIGLCRGKVLDIGAGSGCHSLVLQEMGLDVAALDVIPQAIGIMKERGVSDARLGDVFNFRVNDTGRFDTLLMMMNGIGIVGTLKGLRKFLIHAKKIMKPDGALVMDSNDLRSAVTPEEIAARLASGPRAYFGEVRYQMQYKGVTGPPYWWLYIDRDMLEEMADKTGWIVESFFQTDEGSYLAKLILKRA
ncbi:MAG TPA: methyltransferase domain-containing protein [Firmicutes bacterium]|nr:methyltransferase domain-containing protein [Bacillota bacterium]